MAEAEGVVASAVEVIEIEEVSRLVASGELSAFTAAELAYARSKSDPERRLAARLAAKRAACRLLGEGIGPGDVEIVRGPGEGPRLNFSPSAAARLAAQGVGSALVSLTHERRHAAAAVLLLRRDP